ncbi:MAG: T9SS type A sorting domain-containing protein [Chitinophagaceae bacterium]
MKKQLPFFFLMVALISVAGFIYFKNLQVDTLEHILGMHIRQGNDPDQDQTVSPYERWMWEYNLVKDPSTGRIPAGIRAKEIAVALSISTTSSQYRLSGSNALNQYIAAGPDNIGGRTRAVQYDMRFNGGTNQVMLAGGVNGGIFKSTNGGTSWNWISTPDLNSVTTLVQDPRPGTNPITGRPYQDTWYCGTGEFVPTSYISGPLPSDLAFIVGWGMFISDDNGDSWQPMAFSRGFASQNNNNEYQFDNEYDIINRLVVNPINGDLYVSRFGSVVDVQRTGISTFNRSLMIDAMDVSTLNTTSQVSDLVCTSDGKTVYVGFDGEDTSRCDADSTKDCEGIWQGAVNLGNGTFSWTKIAGGDIATPNGWSTASNYGRIVLGLAPSNQHQLYMLYDNHQNGRIGASGGPKPEADLFKYNDSLKNWVNLSANVPAKDSTGRGAFMVQAGYDMAISVSPSDTNTIFIGGVNAFRSTDGFSSTNNTTLINGYGRTGYNEFGYDHDIGHPDIHWFTFRPGSSAEMTCSDDGGMQKCLNINQADSVSWISLNNQYQTLQYYYVAIDPTNNAMTFGGGAQDNHCTLRNSFNSDPNSQDIYEVGDGCSVGISQIINNQKYFYISSQSGSIYRVSLNPADNTYAGSFTSIKPTGAQGDFITLFYLDPDNTQNLYFASNDTLFRTINASTVTSGTWTQMSGVTGAGKGSLRSLATTRGVYNTHSNLFMGTDQGKILRLQDPENAAPTAIPVDISPVGMSGVVIGLAVNPRHDDTLMAVVSNYNVPSIWWTGNANSANPVWQQIAGNLNGPSIRSCSIVDTQNGVQYYVGCSVGLFSTTAINGASTQWLREGSGPLGFAIVSSLALRWSDNTLVVGTHGDGMFYTNIGSPVVITAVPKVIQNSPDFIREVYPTLSRNSLNFQVGNMYTIPSLNLMIYNILGQVVYTGSASYQDGSVNTSNLPSGVYILNILSSDHTQEFIQKFIKQ